MNPKLAFTTLPKHAPDPETEFEFESEFDIDSALGRLGKVAEKFLSVAETTDNTKVAQAALGIVERALGTIKKYKRPAAAETVDYTVFFLCQLTSTCLRSDSWRSYEDFCIRSRVPKLSKQEFFRRVLFYDFSARYTNGANVFDPPGENSKAGILFARVRKMLPDLQIPEIRIEFKQRHRRNVLPDFGKKLLEQK